MTAFLTALWAALSSVMTGFGGVLADAADGATGLIWDGTNITILGGILIAGVGAGILWLVISLVINLVQSIGNRRAGGRKRG